MYLRHVCDFQPEARIAIREHAARRWRFVFLCTVLTGLTGCLAGQPRFVEAHAEPMGPADQLQGLEFRAALQVPGMAGQSVLLRVSLLDARAEPIRSRDGRFETRAGVVAASKSLLVLPDEWAEGIVRIPAAELGLESGATPRYAEFVLLQPDGAQLAREVVMLPRIGAGSATTVEQRDPQANRVADAQVDPALPDPQESDWRAPESSATVPVYAADAPTDTAAHDATDEPAESDVAFDSSEQAPVASPANTEWDTDGFPSPTTVPTVNGETSVSADDAQSTTDVTVQTETRAAPPASAHDGGVRVYIVRRGDTLTAIARRELGSVGRWREIYELNHNRLESAHHLPLGFELLLPARQPK